MNDRIKELRLFLGLTQESFGEKIGLTKSGISAIENGTRSVTDKHILLLNTAFDVSQDWLRTGKGEMFIHSNHSLIGEVAREYHFDSLDRAILEAYVLLPPEYRKGVKEFMKLIAAQTQANENEAESILRAKLDAAIQEHLSSERSDAQ